MQTKHKDDTVHLMQHEMAARMYDEVIRKDTYRMRSFSNSYAAPKVKTIVDIGANVGYFSLMASCLMPHARRIACEPDVWNFDMLSANMQGLEVECRRMALGKSGGFVDTVHSSRIFSGCDQSKESKTGAPSMLFSEMMEELKVEPEGLMVKMDCEGGEWWMTKDEGLKKWIKGMVYFTAEIHHFNSEKFEDWMSWAHNMFDGMLVSGHVEGNMVFTAVRVGEKDSGKRIVKKVEEWTL